MHLEEPYRARPKAAQESHLGVHLIQVALTLGKVRAPQFGRGEIAHSSTGVSGRRSGSLGSVRHSRVTTVSKAPTERRRASDAIATRESLLPLRRNLNLERRSLRG